MYKGSGFYKKGFSVLRIKGCIRVQGSIRRVSAS